jgi:hypothetical protein
MKTFLAAVIFCVALSAHDCATAATTTVTVDPAAAWLGYMNVSELPTNGGAYVFGSAWGTPDLPATFSGPVLTLAPNSIGDADPFWYVGGGGPGKPGNKIMGANMYVEPTGGVLSGQTVVFTGQVLTNTFTEAHTAIAFIKDFAPDYSSFNVVTVPLVEGIFTLTMDTVADPARHVQYGFETVGVNVWITDVGPYGRLELIGIPEPASVSLAGLGVALLLSRRRKS